MPSHTFTSPILCGTDFSPNASRAATVAAILAASSGATLLLVHVVDEVASSIDSDRRMTAFLSAMKLRLDEEAARLRGYGAKVEIELLNTIGHLPEQVILQTVEERKPSLIVVSSVSKTNFDRWSLGSVSEHLAGNAPIPTLVIRSAAPFEAWAQKKRPLRVFLAADFGSVSGTAIQWAGGLRHLGACELTVAYVDRPDHAWERLGGEGELTFTKNPPAVQESLERNLRERVRDILGLENIKVLVEPIADRPDARLVELADESEADIVIVGTRQRHGLSKLWRPSVSRGILRHASASVACVPVDSIPQEQRPVPEVRRVLVATDFSDPSIRAVRYAHALPSPGGQVLLVHVTPEVKISKLVPASEETRNEAIKERRAAFDEVRERLESLIPEREHSPHLPAGVRTEVHLLEGNDVSGTIIAAAERLGADLICLGSHGRSGLSAALTGSVAREVMKQCHTPVVVVPPAAV